jgi:hypothetical protein
MIGMVDYHRVKMNDLKSKRDKIEKRFVKVANEATVDGEDEWFRDFVKNDCDCALKTIIDCERQKDV